ncbi:MAG: hypothetical protein OXG71_07185, partial [Rhodospirillales bacterium]|nr:hypothetical protein [Rhodospirillales bacterium]
MAESYFAGKWHPENERKISELEIVQDVLFHAKDLFAVCLRNSPMPRRQVGLMHWLLMTYPSE